MTSDHRHVEALQRRITELEHENRVLRDTTVAANGDDAWLQTILHRATDYAIVATDTEGRITHWNDGARTLFGWSEAEVRGRHCALMFTSEDREAGVPDTRLANARSTGRSEDERWYLHKDGSRFFGGALLLSLQGTSSGGFLKILTDRTEAHRVTQAWQLGEERLRLILESAVDYAIFTIDRAGVVTSWNSGAERLLGYSEDQALGMDSRGIFTPDDRAAGAPEWEIDTAMAEGRAADERWHVRKDGSRFWGSGLMMPLQAGEPVPGLLKIMRDETSRRKAQERQQLLIDELNHRVKNTLATVQALADQTLKTAQSPEAFPDAFRSRLFALARAHDMLTRQAWEMVHIEDMVRAALDTWIREQRVSLSGPPVRVSPKQAIAVSMALHELTTNAAKYGALSVPEGAVDISWHCDLECELRWRERNGPPVSPPVRRGFGWRILNRALATELDRPVDLRFESAGVTCILRFEMEHEASVPIDLSR
ncbi:PAS domain S-box protein [Parapusillimonas sp. SGNA-6]|nr:PAS domain S-box protein [Parapusillimonas sp. SGNA-6]